MTATQAPAGQRPVLDVSGERTPVGDVLRGLVRHWRLLPMLARQDFQARYRSATLGVLWSVFLPVLQGAVLAIVFTQVVRIPTDVPYPVFIIVGMVTWSYFNQSLSTGATAIVDNGGLAGKVYFPRLILPAVPAAANVVGYAISMLLVLALMALFGVAYGWSLALLPVAMLLTGVFAVAAAASLAILHVYFRDTKYIVTAGILIAFYGTPVIYPLDMAPDWLQPIILANPATGIIQFVRWSIFGEIAGGIALPLGITGAWFAALVVLALAVFRRHERIAVDRL